MLRLSLNEDHTSTHKVCAVVCFNMRQGSLSLFQHKCFLLSYIKIVKFLYLPYIPLKVICLWMGTMHYQKSTAVVDEYPSSEMLGKFLDFGTLYIYNKVSW